MKTGGIILHESHRQALYIACRREVLANRMTNKTFFTKNPTKMIKNELMFRPVLATKVYINAIFVEKDLNCCRRSFHTKTNKTKKCQERRGDTTE